MFYFIFDVLPNLPYRERLLRGIFRPSVQEVTGGRRKLHNEEIKTCINRHCFVTKLKHLRWEGYMEVTEGEQAYIQRFGEEV